MVLWSGVPVFRCSGVPVFRCSGVPMFRSSGVPMFRSSGAPVFRCSAVPQFRCSHVSIFRCSGGPVVPWYGGDALSVNNPPQAMFLISCKCSFSRDNDVLNIRFRHSREGRSCFDTNIGCVKAT